MTNFVSLHNQTQSSLLDSIISTKDLFLKAKELGQSAVAITDHGSLGSAWDALKYSRDTKVKLIIGCELYFEDHFNEKDSHIILIAKNAIGYRNLLTINKKGFDNNIFNGKRVYPRINWDLLESHSEGLICLTACGNGIISQKLMARDFDKADEYVLRLKSIFNDNLGLEILPNNMKRAANYASFEIDQTFINRQLINLGKKHNIRVVAACNAHYLNKEDHEVHDVLLSIGSHQPVYSNFRLKYSVPDFYLKTGDEVKNFFKRNYGEEASTEFCENSIYFSDLCEFPDWIDPKHSNPSGKELPHFPVQDQYDYDKFKSWELLDGFKYAELKEDQKYLRYSCYKAFEKYKKFIKPEQYEEYETRLVEEFDVLEFHGFSSYMLIVADYVSWAKNNNIPVGTGRGSAGGSLVAFLLNIHIADPIKYGLIFARFHNKEKTSYPDIDVDFAPSGRDKVKDYIRNKYGDSYVAHVSNVNTITPKVYVKDISRALELGGSKEKAVEIGQMVADCIPADIKNIDEAIKKIPIFVEYCKKYPEFIKYKEICGMARALSTHAGGLLIAARPLEGLVPLRRDKDGNLAVEYDKDKSEANGLVKMDILGLSTLDILKKTNELIYESTGTIPKIDLDLYDEPTYDLLSSGNTYGVFQLGTSGGTIELCKKIEPKSIDDISSINSLARPSAKDMRSDFIATKIGKKKMTLLHPNLDRAFGSTYGFGLYEECLMYLAQDIAGWNLHEADRLRKLTKEKGKNPQKAKQLMIDFVNGAVKSGVNEEIAKRIWIEVVENFGGYGFNKSHSVLYSMISYQTAYLKAHYPVEFLLANLMAEAGSSDPKARASIAKIKKEIRNNNVKIIPPDINKSQLTYVIEDGNKLVTGLDALKFVSDDAINDIIQKRPFKNFADFMVRVDSKKVRSNSIQALAAVGALDCFGIDRKSIFLYVSDYRKRLQSWLKKHDPNTEEFNYPWIKEASWSVSEIYALEQFYLGESFICKPPRAYKDFFSKNDHKVVSDIKKSKDKTNFPSVKAIVKDFFEFKVKKETSKFYGQSMAKIVIADRFGDECSCTIFPDRWGQLQSKLKQVSKKATFEVGLALHFGGNSNMYDDEMGIILDSVYGVSLPPALPADLKPKRVIINKSKVEESSNDLIEALEDSLYDQGLIDIE